MRILNISWYHLIFIMRRFSISNLSTIYYFNFLTTLYEHILMIFLFIIKRYKNTIHTFCKFLQYLRKASIYINIDKCELHIQEAKFLGLIISTDSICIYQRKSSLVVEWAPSICFCHVKSFLWFFKFYWQFIQNFSKLAKSLISFTKKKSSFN